MKCFRSPGRSACLLLLSFAAPAPAGDWSPPGVAGQGEYTRASNSDSIVNTRHNFTFSYSNGFVGFMNGFINPYGEVCVFCHTPHGASQAIDAPLWNRTVASSGSYTTYISDTLSQQPQAPGTASLTCLSCHDGTIPVDSIINMPGSGGYEPAQQTTVSDSFLDGWSNITHAPLGDEDNHGYQPGTCMECHDDDNFFGIPEFAVPGIYDFASGMVQSGGLSFFDTDGDSRADSNELRLYFDGDDYRVECASCHDPHGVPESGGSGPLIASFLRVDSDDSTICLSCHVK